MRPRQQRPNRRVLGVLTIAAMLLSLAPFAAGCSAVPTRDWPPSAEHAVVADYAITAGGPIEVPTSTVDLTILALTVDPPPAQETWRAGRRFVTAPAGCDHVRVTCRYRAYARSGRLPDAALLFPGAVITATTP